jgi:hypothetical protein
VNEHFLRQQKEKEKEVIGIVRDTRVTITAQDWVYLNEEREKALLEEDLEAIRAYLEDMDAIMDDIIGEAYDADEDELETDGLKDIFDEHQWTDEESLIEIDEQLFAHILERLELDDESKLNRDQVLAVSIKVILRIINRLKR